MWVAMTCRRPEKQGYNNDEGCFRHCEHASSWRVLRQEPSNNSLPTCFDSEIDLEKHGRLVSTLARIQF